MKYVFRFAALASSEESATTFQSAIQAALDNDKNVGDIAQCSIDSVIPGASWVHARVTGDVNLATTFKASIVSIVESAPNLIVGSAIYKQHNSYLDEDATSHHLSVETDV